MVDAEVLRLRKLRNVALRARAFGKSLGPDPTADSLYARGTVICWTIARIATGRLRAHPYLSYQKDQSQFTAIADEAFAAIAAMTAQRQKRGLHAFEVQLQTLTREVDDVRSLTWSAELSDALGRMQVHLRRLAMELECKLPTQRSAAVLPRAQTEESWPYLAI